MKRTTVIGLSVLAVVALLGISAASAHGGFNGLQARSEKDGAGAHFGMGPGHDAFMRVRESCGDETTREECRALVHETMHAKCVAKHDEAFCAERQAEHEARMAEGHERFRYRHAEHDAEVHGESHAEASDDQPVE